MKVEEIKTKIYRKTKKFREKPKLFCTDFYLNRIKEYHFIKGVVFRLHAIKMFLLVVKKRSLFAITFLIPLIVFSSYTIIIRQRLYESHASIILKSSSELSSNSAFAPALLMEYIQDLFLLKEYINSYEAFERLDNDLRLKKRWQRLRLDMFSRYNGFNKEYLLNYYNRLIKVKIDKDTGIMTIYTNDVDPIFAQKFVSNIIKIAEEHINKINMDTNHKKSLILNELSRSIKDKIFAVRAEMQKYQTKSKTVHAQKEIEGIVGVLSHIESELMKEKMKLAEMSSYMDQNAVQLKAAEDKIQSMEKKIISIKEKIIKDDNDQLGNSWSIHFANLEVELELFLKEYGSILGLIEKVQANIILNTKYLIITQQPFLPDYCTYPRIIYNIVLCAIILGVCYMILQSMINFVKEYE